MTKSEHSVRRELFIGRFNPPTKGHLWLMNQVEGPIAVLVRDTPINEKNPLGATQVRRLLEKIFKAEGRDAYVQVIPDIANIHIGRTVGYGVIEHEPPKDIHGISATEVRARIAKGDETWQEFVHDSIWGDIKDLLAP